AQEHALTTPFHLDTSAETEDSIGGRRMLPIYRFNALVVSVTVSIMYLLLLALWPLIARLSANLNTDGLQHYVLAAVVAGLGALGSVAVYKFLVSSLNSILERYSFVRRFVMGPHYVEGTWVGYNLIGGNCFYVVDRYEQSLSGAVMVNGGNWRHSP